MPVQRCQKDGRPGFRWGKSGKCYTYTPGDARSKTAARLKAELQGKAIKARQSKE